jgi:hypothetical protein
MTLQKLRCGTYQQKEKLVMTSEKQKTQHKYTSVISQLTSGMNLMSVFQKKCSVTTCTLWPISCRVTFTKIMYGHLVVADIRCKYLSFNALNLYLQEQMLYNCTWWIFSHAYTDKLCHISLFLYFLKKIMHCLCVLW